MVLSGVEIYAKLYSYDDGSGSLLELSSNPDYESEEEGVTLLVDYGMFGNVDYDYWASGIKVMPPWLSERYYDDEYNIKKVRIVDEIKPKSTACWFLHLYDLVEIENMSNINTSEVTDMSDMFYECVSLESLDVSGFDTSNVISMGGMFRNCSKLETIYVGKTWDDSQADKSNMFYGCKTNEVILKEEQTDI